MQTLFIFLFVIIILVVAHELGHFFVAKLFGVKVEEFGLGYPPRAKKLFVWKGTLFTLNWLPFGGFVKIFGEDGDDSKDAIALSTSFSHQNIWKRWAILVAGITANLVLAVVLYAMAFSIGFLGNAKEFPEALAVSHQDLTITEVIKGAPADVIGLKANDKVTSLSLVTEDVAFTPTTPEEFTHFIQANGGQQISVGVLRNGKEQFFTVVPKMKVVGDKPAIGVGIDQIGTLRMPFLKSFAFAFHYTIAQFEMIIVSLCSLITGAFYGKSGIASSLSGPVGIAKFAGAAYSMGIGALLSFMAVISMGDVCFWRFFLETGKAKFLQRLLLGLTKLDFCF